MPLARAGPDGARAGAACRAPPRSAPPAHPRVGAGSAAVVHHLHDRGLHTDAARSAVDDEVDREPSSARTSAAVVGLTRPKRLADGAATGPPASSSRRVRPGDGRARAGRPCPARRSAADGSAAARRSTTRVSGPGHSAAASRPAASCTSAAQRASSSAAAMCTIRGWSAGRPLAAVDTGDGGRVRGVGAQAVDGLGREGHEAPGPETGRGTRPARFLADVRLRRVGHASTVGGTGRGPGGGAPAGRNLPAPTLPDVKLKPGGAAPRVLSGGRRGTAPGWSSWVQRGAAPGVLAGVVAMAAWAASGVIAKGIDMSGMAIILYRMWMYSVVVLVWLTARGGRLTWHAMRAGGPGWARAGRRHRAVLQRREDDDDRQRHRHQRPAAHPHDLPGQPPVRRACPGTGGGAVAGGDRRRGGRDVRLGRPARRRRRRRPAGGRVRCSPGPPTSSSRSAPRRR